MATIVMRIKCDECSRAFNLLDTVDAGDWYWGHDCEQVGATMAERLKRYPHPPNGYAAIEERLECIAINYRTIANLKFFGCEESWTAL